MDKLEISASKHTPRVLLDPHDWVFNFSGSSMPENADSFYRPILNWLDEFVGAEHSASMPLSVTMRFDYYNSGSMRYIAEIFKRIAAIHASGMKVLIDWYYDEEDDLLREAGEELSEISGLPFNYMVAE